MTDVVERLRRQWWYRPTLRGIEFRFGVYPGAGWLPSSRKDKT
jgi:hypothetical protein